MSPPLGRPSDASSWVFSKHPMILLLLCLPYCLITVYVLVSPSRLSKNSISQTHTRNHMCAENINGKHWMYELVNKSQYFLGYYGRASSKYLGCCPAENMTAYPLSFAKMSDLIGLRCSPDCYRFSDDSIA